MGNSFAKRFAQSRLRSVIVLGSMVIVLGACTGAKPSEIECTKFADHFVEVLQNSGHKGRKVEKLGTEHRDTIMERCVKYGTKSQVACSMEAEKVEDLLACK